MVVRVVVDDAVAQLGDRGSQIRGEHAEDRLEDPPPFRGGDIVERAADHGVGVEDVPREVAVGGRVVEALERRGGPTHRPPQVGEKGRRPRLDRGERPAVQVPENPCPRRSAVRPEPDDRLPVARRDYALNRDAGGIESREGSVLALEEGPVLVEVRDFQHDRRSIVGRVNEKVPVALARQHLDRAGELPPGRQRGLGVRGSEPRPRRDPCGRPDDGSGRGRGPGR